MSTAGFFISFEGGEGGGKTTQISRLAETLVKEGRSVLTTREPGGTPEGEKIRALLVHRQGGDWGPMAECLLLFAARLHHVEHVIKPALAEGKIVISDRFTDSTRAYQGCGHGLEPEKIGALDALVLGGFGPDLTFILDIDPAEGLERAAHRLAAEALQADRLEDRFEGLDMDFHRRLRRGFLDIAAQAKDRCVVIDATRPADEVAALIAETLKGRLN